jgi:hypothetical protein
MWALGRRTSFVSCDTLPGTTVLQLTDCFCRRSEYARDDHCYHGRLGSGSEAAAGQEVGEEER